MVCQSSSVVEQRTHKPLVGSSNLPFGTIFLFTCRIVSSGHPKISGAVREFFEWIAIQARRLLCSPTFRSASIFRPYRPHNRRALRLNNYRSTLRGSLFQTLKRFGPALHDRFLLPANLWQVLESRCANLRRTWRAKSGVKRVGR